MGKGKGPEKGRDFKAFREGMEYLEKMTKLKKAKGKNKNPKQNVAVNSQK